MISTYKNRNSTWIRLENPTSDELSYVQDEYNIYHHTIEEMAIKTEKPKIDFLGEYIYLVLHFPSIKDRHNSHTGREIDFVLKKDTLITIEYEPSEFMNNFAKKFESNKLLTHAGFTFYYLITNLYKTLTKEGDKYTAELHTTEQKIFSATDKDLVFKLAKINHNIFDFNYCLENHLEILLSLEEAGTKIFGSEFSYYLKDIINEQKKSLRHAKNNYSFIEELQKTNSTLISLKQNDTMRVFTILAFITLPVQIIIAISSFSGASNPLMVHQSGFWIILSFVLICICVLLIYFKHKKWL